MSILALPDSGFLPGPLWLLSALHLLTLALHLVAMNCLFGGLVAVLGGPFPDRWNQPLVQRLVKLLPVLMAATVTLGVAPLLFVQLVYGDVIYSAAIVSGWFWILIPTAAVVAYYGLYAAAFTKRGAGRRRAWLLVALAALLFISLNYSSVFALAEDPAAQRTLHAEDPSGLVWNPAVGRWIPRWLHMVTGALTVGGFLVGLLGRADATSFQAGRKLYAGGMLLAALTGVAYLLTLGGDLAGFMRSAGIWWLTAGVVLALGSLHFFFKRRFLPAGVMLFVSLLGMVVARHALRLVRLEGVFDPAAAPVDPQWDVFAIFLVSFVVGLALVVWMLRVFFRKDARPAG